MKVQTKYKARSYHKVIFGNVLFCCYWEFLVVMGTLEPTPNLYLHNFLRVSWSAQMISEALKSLVTTTIQLTFIFLYKLSLQKQ